MGLTQSIDGRNKNYGDYTTDNYNVYWKGTVVEEATAKTFVDMGGGYGKDRFDSFYKGKLISKSRQSPNA